MNTLEKQVDALMRLCTACDESQRQEAREELRFLLKGGTNPRREKEPEWILREVLLELGAPDHLIGHPFVVEAVMMTVEDRRYINNITFGLYPQIAAKFDTTASRVERGIRHLIEVTWTRGDMDVLCGYFGNTISADRGKPTNGEFIARLCNIVQQRLKEAG